MVAIMLVLYQPVRRDMPCFFLFIISRLFIMYFLACFVSSLYCCFLGTNPVATVGGYVQLPANNYTALMNAVAKVGPIAIAVDASNWHSYESGVFNGCNQENPDINHGVVLVGYGEENGQKYWIVRNSWSPNFGEKGYIRVARSNQEDKHCGLDVTPQDGIACAGDDKPEKVRNPLAYCCFSYYFLIFLGLWNLWYYL
jgi:hypothetical protein